MSSATTGDPRLDYVLRLGDNALVAGQRLGELVAHGPELEEEMAVANFALDYIGQARYFYSLAAEIEGKGKTEDEYAYFRDGIDFQNLLLLEQPNGHFGDTIVRQFLFESFYSLQLARLEASSEPQLAALAVRASKEIRYHLRHARKWLVRLGDGTDESHEKVQAALDNLWRFSGEMFAGDDVDRAAAASGLGPDPAELEEAWSEYVDAALAEATLERPSGDGMLTGGKQGRHSEHLGYLLAELQSVQRAYPGLDW